MLLLCLHVGRTGCVLDLNVLQARHAPVWIKTTMPCVVLQGEAPSSWLEAVHSSLLLDGEAVYSLVANPLLLLLARVVLAKCCDLMGHLQVRKPLRHLHLRCQGPGEPMTACTLNIFSTLYALSTFFIFVSTTNCSQKNQQQFSVLHESTIFLEP